MHNLNWRRLKSNRGAYWRELAGVYVASGMASSHVGRNYSDGSIMDSGLSMVRY